MDDVLIDNDSAVCEPLPNITLLCTDEDIKAYSERLCQEEERLEQQLERHLSVKCQLSARLVGLQRACPDISRLMTDTKQLSQVVEVTSQLARQVSAKVKQLDLAKTRVAESQAVVNDLLDVKSCADSVRQAMTDEHYERAAVHVHRFLSISSISTALLTAQADVADGGGGEEADELAASVAMLQKAESRLVAIARKYFSQAVQADDAASIERFFKMFPLLNKHEEGVALFSAHLCQKLETSAAQIRRDAASNESSGPRAAVIWADTFTLLYEAVARLVEIHQPIIETFYGPGWLMSMIRDVHVTTSKHASLIMETFMKARQITNKVDLAKRLLRSSDGVETNMDVRQLDLVLTEISLIGARTDIYTCFVRRRVSSDIQAGYVGDESATKMAQFEEFITGSALNRISQDLISNYITLESYYMTESLRKAVKLNCVEEGCLTSSLVDDAFFIIKKCIRRAMTSRSVDCTCALLNISSAELDTQFMTAVEQPLQVGFPSGHLDLSQAYSALQSSLQQGRLSTGSETDRMKSQFLTALNNVHVSRQYLERLCDELDAELIESGTKNSTTDSNAICRDEQKLKSCLSGLRALIGRFDGATKEAMKQLRTGAIRSRIKPWLETLTSTPHVITEADLARFEAEDRFVGALISRVDTLLNSTSVLLLPELAQLFKQATLEELAVQLEKAILKSSYNRYGGLQLDKEVRALVSYLLSVTSWLERDKLSRVNQIATLLNMEHVSEVQELRGANSSITWKLSPNEIKKVMCLRVDFKPEEVRRIKL